MLSQEMKDQIAPILGRVPSGVFILVAASESGQKTGMLASWVQQASFDPPQLTVAVNRTRYLNDWLLEGTAVTLNQVAQGDNKLFKHFGKGFEPDVDAFAGLDVVPGSNGLPLLTSSMASIEGSIVTQMDAGDHVIYLMQITSATAHGDATASSPFVHIRKNGFTY